jgi:hypothetical protein
MERQPEKLQLFPSDLLHFMLRSNEIMSGFLRDYFQHSLTYLDYLQRHNPGGSLAQPMHWVKAWLDGIGASMGENGREQPRQPSERLALRIEQLEERLRQLESREAGVAESDEVKRS